MTTPTARRAQLLGPPAKGSCVGDAESRRTVRSPVEFDVSVPAVVLKLHRIHHGGLAVIRSLGRTGIPVYSVHNERFNPIMVSKYLAGSFVWRPDMLDHAQLLSGVLDIGRSIGRRSLLVPTDDLSALFIAEHAEELAPLFLFPSQAPELTRTLMNKGSLYERCVELNVSAPRVRFVTSPGELRKYVRTGQFPIVVKVSDPAGLASNKNMKSTTIAWTAAELSQLAQSVEAVPVGTLLLQEYLPAESAEDWFVHGYCDDRSKCLVAFSGRKLRSCPPHAGMTTLGQPIVNEALLRQALEFVGSIGYRGVFDLCWRLDRRDQQFKLLDFNPRVGAQFAVGVNAAGVDVVRALHLDLTGRPVPCTDQLEDGALLIEDFDLLGSFRATRTRQLTLRAWVSSLREVRTFGWWAHDDPLPFTGMCARRVGNALQQQVGRGARMMPQPTKPHYVPGRTGRQSYNRLRSARWAESLSAGAGTGIGDEDLK